MFLIRSRFSLTPLWRCLIILAGTVILVAILSGCSSQEQLPPTAIVQVTVPSPSLTPSPLPPASPTLVPSPSATATPLVSPTVVPATPTPTPTIPNTPTIVPVELVSTPAAAVPSSCEPTLPDGLGPFYVPNAPERTRVGQGHILRGRVKSSRDCTTIAGAQLEFWLAGPSGEYSDAYRATVFADDAGMYQFESNFPPPYSGRPSHIHLRVTAAGYQTLVTQYYPTEGQTEGAFDLVLLPEN